jgi:hypothetical protein
VLGPTFLEGKSKVINTEETFETLHTVLHYIYTQTIFLRTSPEMEAPKDVPAYLTPEEIYAVSHRLNLTNLEEIALNFLSNSCDRTNIAQRMFDDFSLLYEDISEMYEEHFMKHLRFFCESDEMDEISKKMANGEFSGQWCERLCSVLKKLSGRLSDV